MRQALRKDEGNGQESQKWRLQTPLFATDLFAEQQLFQGIDRS